MNKKEIRKNILKKRKNINHNYWNLYSYLIIQKIFRKFNLMHKKIGIYFPINNEINTLSLFNVHNLNLFIPKIEKNKMAFFEIPNNSKINVHNFFKNKNNYKLIPDVILENKTIQPKIKQNKIIPDIILIPIVAFNKKCFRVGYGGGYYDRYLHNKNVLKIGIAFDLQKAEFHVEHHDIPLDYIFTERKIYQKACKKLFQI
jgi:5-formyltetrahydrofolate cyclo-ligase